MSTRAGTSPARKARRAMGSKSGAALTARRISIAIVVLVVAGTAVFRIARPEFRPPVQRYELLNLRHYTWAGLNADGSFRSVANLDEFNHLGKVSLGRIA